MATTLDTLTDHQIRCLESNAFAAGDALMGYACRVALGEEYEPGQLNDESCLTVSEQREIMALDRQSAREMVVSAILDAEGQQ